MKSRVLVLGFFGEGVRDYGFLLPVVQRTLQKQLPLYDILPIKLDYVDSTGLGDAEKLRRVAEETTGFGIVVYHLDADAPNTKKATQRFDRSYRQLLKDDGKVNTDIVPVIPVRMTDAWLLVDFEAFRQTVGTRLDPEALGFKRRPREVEAIRNPKKVFEDAVKKARPGRRRAIPIEDVYLPLAERISLELLEKVPAYKEFKEQLTSMLKTLHYV